MKEQCHVLNGMKTNVSDINTKCVFIECAHLSQDITNIMELCFSGTISINRNAEMQRNRGDNVGGDVYNLLVLTVRYNVHENGDDLHEDLPEIVDCTEDDMIHSVNWCPREMSQLTKNKVICFIFENDQKIQNMTQCQSTNTNHRYSQIPDAVTNHIQNRDIGSFYRHPHNLQHQI